MNLTHLLRRAARRFLVRPSRAVKPPFVLKLEGLESREVPADSSDWLGKAGIQADALGLTGKDIAIGQIELGRPGIANFDARWNAKVTPTEALFRDGAATKNEGSVVENVHATGVAGILIRDGDADRGIAKEAKLYSSALDNGGGVDPKDWEVIRTFQAIALKHSDDLSAINHSAGRTIGEGEKFDGSSEYTKGVDFVAWKYDTLVVLSGVNGTPTGKVYPRDGYNVLTVRSVFDALVGQGEEIGNEKVVARRVADSSVDLVTDEPVATQRILTHLVAPTPREVASSGPNGVADDRKVGAADSHAAPLATGTVALLQEAARKPNSGLGPDAKQDEVMKAVLINSVDKKFGLLDGMTRTVLGKNGKSTWFDSAAADTPNKNIANPYDASDPQNKARQALPLDIEMGAGFLNADRALRQLKGKQYAPQTAAEVIGWDYRSITRAQGDASPTRKVYNLPELKGGSYISATLTWNREVAWNDANNNSKYDQNEALTPAALANLDLYLLPRSETDLTKAVWASNSVQYNVEHFFVQLPLGNKQYDLVVVQNSVAATDYGLAWWAEAGKSNGQAPYKIDGIAWEDANGNGTREAVLGEEGLAGVRVQLLDAANQVVDEVTTNVVGAYQFEGVATGNYTVRFVTPARAAITLQDVYNPLQGADDTNDSDINTLGVVSVTVGQSNVSHVDAGYTFSDASPVGVTDTYTSPHGGTLTVSVANGVLTNDSDPENATLTAELFRAPDFGTLTLASDGSFTYEFAPTLGFSGPVTFEYIPVDTAGPGDPVTVTIQIPNLVPVAVDDTKTTTEDTAVTISVRANDTDANSDTLAIVGATQGTYGLVEWTETGITYTPDPNWSGTDTFEYTIDDGFGGRATAVVTITTDPVNDGPIINPPTPILVQQNTVIDIDLRTLVHDVETAPNYLTFTVSNAVNGAILLLPDGFTARFTPVAGYFGVASFGLSVTDTGDGTNPPATINATVNATVYRPTVWVAPTALNMTEGVAGTFSVKRNGDLSSSMTVTLALGMVSGYAPPDAGYRLLGRGGVGRQRISRRIVPELLADGDVRRGFGRGGDLVRSARRRTDRGDRGRAGHAQFGAHRLHHRPRGQCDRLLLPRRLTRALPTKTGRMDRHRGRSRRRRACAL